MINKLLFVIVTITRLMYTYLTQLLLYSSVVGLDAAGKTTILYKLKLGEIVTTIPTIGKKCQC